MVGTIYRNASYQLFNLHLRSQLNFFIPALARNFPSNFTALTREVCKISFPPREKCTPAVKSSSERRENEDLDGSESYCAAKHDIHSGILIDD